MKLYPVLLVAVIVTLYFIPDTHGRPAPEVIPKQKYGPSKKLRFKQLMDWIVSLDDDSSDTDALRESLATLTVITDLQGRNGSGSPITDISPISHCVQACFGNTTSVSVSVLHECNRQCMLSPHRFDHPGNATNHSRNSGSGASRRP
ncbi:unnamed protein product [Candidula unifasciata]|uniref:Uncharacterized protein n=1 Tax=Candidula unifasciata TaxID=100452 RepID=A0A8S3YD34_9EUPU|nr:unnamed protein product [Candidula unifasciata]